MLVKKLKENIPSKIATFEKFKKEEPYHFYEWKEDEKGETYLRYWFKASKKPGKHKKRIFISELREFFKETIDNELIWFTSSIFKKKFLHTNSDGACGFTVIVRILEYLNIAKYEGLKGCRIINKEIMKSLLTT